MHLRLALIASLTAAVLAVGPATASAGPYDYLVAPISECGGQKQVDTRLSTGDQEWVMRCMHKYARVRKGRARLAGHRLLQTSSDRKVYDMLRCNAFSHTACGRETLYHVKRVGYTNCTSWRAGENIAWGTEDRGSVRAIMRAWVNSTPHPHEHPRPQVQAYRRRDAQGNVLGSPERPGVDDALRLPLLLIRARGI